MMFLWVLLSSGKSWNNALQCLNFLSFDLSLPPFNCINWSVAFHDCCHHLWCTAVLVHTEILTILLKKVIMSLFCWGDTIWNDLFRFAWGNFCRASESQPAGWTTLVLSKCNLPLAHALFWTQQASHYFFILSSLSISSIFPWWAFPCSCLHYWTGACPSHVPSVL